MTLELRHFSPERFELDRNREYLRAPAFKPRGFWVTIPGDDDWPSWCRSEGFGVHRLAIENRVTLTTEANILLIETVAALDEFNEAHRGPLYPGAREPFGGIDWETVTGLHDGIIIAPYQWTRRYDLMWYSGWDVASGCIWNLEAIASVTVMEPEDA